VLHQGPLWDLSRWFTARLALRNGKVLWSGKGTYAHCNGRLYAAPGDEDGDGGEEVEAYPVRCRYVGRAEYANGKAKYDALRSPSRATTSRPVRPPGMCRWARPASSFSTSMSER
jgi:hypothetical protein